MDSSAADCEAGTWPILNRIYYMFSTLSLPLSYSWSDCNCNNTQFSDRLKIHYVAIDIFIMNGRQTDGDCWKKWRD